MTVSVSTCKNRKRDSFPLPFLWGGLPAFQQILCLSKFAAPFRNKTGTKVWMCISTHAWASIYLFTSCVLSLSAIPPSVFAHSGSPPPMKYLYFFELMTEKPQTSFPCAAAPGRLTERHNIVWRDIVPTWAQALTSCLYKLSSVVFARRWILLWCLNPYWDANCSCILPPTLSVLRISFCYRSIYVVVFGWIENVCLPRLFIVFVIVHA